MSMIFKCVASSAALAVAAVVTVGCGAGKDKDTADLLKQVEALQTQLNGELKPVETKIAAMKSDAEKATGDAKKDGEAKVAEVTGMLAKIKEKIDLMTELKDAAPLTALQLEDKVRAMIADLKKKVGL